jgi:hypothetical protein
MITKTELSVWAPDGDYALAQVELMNPTVRKSLFIGADAGGITLHRWVDPDGGNWVSIEVKADDGTLCVDIGHESAVKLAKFLADMVEIDPPNAVNLKSN